MKRATWIVPGLFALGGALALPVGCSQSPTVPAQRGEINLAALDDPAAQVAGYREWRVVNPEPHDVGAYLAALCTLVTNEQLRSNPHIYRRSGDVQFGGAPIRVFVNPRAERSMLEQREPRFPAGAIIVKEKLPPRQPKWLRNLGQEESEPEQGLEPAVQNDLPELLTVMIKREPGYNPEVGDWEFLVFDGSGQAIQGRGRLAHCQQCHIPQAASDFVFRSYLPEEVRSALR